uniref:3CxxC-type domain-containing protein n=1 Tax=Nothobranchius furzeri TaxID=105023 RepID=A0A8C6W0K0_NOTFU
METEKWTSIFQNKIQTLQKRDTWRLEFHDNIEPKHANFGWKEYIGRTIIRCTSCARSWPSNRTMVVFHMQLRNGQGTVKVQPLLQNCKMCADAPMVKPGVEIKFYRERVGQRKQYFGYLDVDSPHEPTHCDGCKLGVCRMDVGAEREQNGERGNSNHLFHRS